MTDPADQQNTNSPFHQSAREVHERSVSEIHRSREWADLSPAERYDRTQADGDAATNRVDPQKVIQTRDRAGNLVLKDRETGKVLNEPSAEPSPTGDVDPAAALKHKVGRFEVSEEEIGELLADKAQRELARANTPSDPSGYELRLPEDFKMPEGKVLEFDSNSPMAQAAQNWAHKRGLSQGDFSDLLSIYAHGQAQEADWYAGRHREEMDSLGTTGPQRIDAVTRFVVAEMGHADAKPIIASMASAAHVRFYERMIQRVTSQGVGRFSPSRHAPDKPGLSDETWDSMSYSERKAYAERASAGR